MMNSEKTLANNDQTENVDIEEVGQTIGILKIVKTLNEKQLSTFITLLPFLPVFDEGTMQNYKHPPVGQEKNRPANCIYPSK